MKKIALIGGGHHSRQNHLPALQRYCAENPGEIELRAFCDINEDVARQTAERYQFTNHYNDIAAMLEAETLDGVIAVTPVAVTQAVATQIIEQGLPLVIEKPPGKSMAEAEAICDLVKSHNAHAMVSVNRRFDPALTAARDWLSSRKVAYCRATMLRVNRREPNFFSETALHVLDAMRWFLGDIESFSQTVAMVDGVAWRTVDLQFSNGAIGRMEVLPTCGIRDERFDFFGPDFCALATNGEMSTGEFKAWENGELTVSEEPAKDQPGFIRNGTLEETAEFIQSLSDGRQPTPTPHDILQSVEICHQVEAGVNQR